MIIINNNNIDNKGLNNNGDNKDHKDYRDNGNNGIIMGGGGIDKNINKIDR